MSLADALRIEASMICRAFANSLLLSMRDSASIIFARGALIYSRDSIALGADYTMRRAPAMIFDWPMAYFGQFSARELALKPTAPLRYAALISLSTPPALGQGVILMRCQRYFEQFVYIAFRLP